MVGRILMLMWSFGALRCRSLRGQSREEGSGLTSFELPSTQSFQKSLIKECTLNHIGIPNMIQVI